MTMTTTASISECCHALLVDMPAISIDFGSSNRIASTTVSFLRLRNMAAFQLLREIFSLLFIRLWSYFLVTF